MLYIYRGTDHLKTRSHFGKLIAGLLAKRKDANLFKFDNENFDAERFRELIISQDLFAGKYIVTGDRLLGNKKTRELVAGAAREMQESANVFILLEEEIDPKILTKIKKYIDKETVYDKAEIKENRFNIFALTDALGEKNKKKLWVIYQKALRAGIEDEEIFWKFNWMVKNMLFFKKAKDPNKSELKGFARNKTERYAKNFTTAELEKLSSVLVDLFHQVRRSEGEFETGLERLIFEI